MDYIRSTDDCQFTDGDGEVAQAFVAKLQSLSPNNSKGELSIERFLVKSEEAFFERVKKEKISSAASILSSKRDSIWHLPSLYYESRPVCAFGYIYRRTHLTIYQRHLQGPSMQVITQVNSLIRTCKSCPPCKSSWLANSRDGRCMRLSLRWAKC